MATVLDISVACPDEASAREIADALIGQRLAACCQTGSPIESRYRWKGAIETAREVPLLIKTLDAHFDAVADLVAELHPYELPVVTAQTVLADDTTLRWIQEACIPEA